MTDVCDGRMLRVAVIGAGQAGLSAAYYLAARGLEPWREFVVVDANEGPGGAWRHRWDSLTLDRAHAIHPLPGAPLETRDPTEPANRVVPRYFGDYERRFALPVLRPVSVTSLTHDESGFTVHTGRGPLAAASIISATGTWDSPYLPHYPGIERFAGRQLHTHDYRSAEEFRGQRVLIVGGGTSAVQAVQELYAHGAEPVWSTRRAPQWTRRAFDAEWGLSVEKSVAARTRQGLAPLSVSAATGLPLNELYAPDITAGLLVSRGPIVRFTERGVVLDGPGPDGAGKPDQGEADALVGATAPLPGRAVDDGWDTPIDTVLWATGFRAHIPHLRGLGTRERSGGVVMADDGVTVVKLPGLFLAGYGASASTLGATRAGRKAAMAALRVTQERAAAAA
ncbi:FAD-dependent oxidoreductase [Microbacterium horticulturae]|uniref:FAD-dependent oxidoreductase n=1 Tax=Microbacterium horticulturae TaxID=3028316 RepID=A0ABY8C123_9MICO|nr:FAD-dependent oxidoreductase [Microbacterium sp. KACC 23027]WEG08746.1 FAD-dependent oxidoreductase [Microbacterium sp. KACC 23027]